VALSDALSIVVALLCFRSLPFFAVALLSRQIAFEGKCLASLLYVGLLAIFYRVSGGALGWLGTICIGYVYFAVLTLALVQLARSPLATAFGAMAWLSISALGYVVVPALIARGVAKVSLILLGWEMMFAAFSLVSALGLGRACSSTTALWFVLVDPSLVFDLRAQQRREPGFTKHGVLRCLAGCALLTVHHAAFIWAGAVLARALPPIGPHQIRSLVDYGQWFGHYSTQVLILYAGHAGLAGFHVGVMHCLGYDLRERYHYPLYAKEPQDFWRRWNTYLGSWLEYYVFIPSVTRVVRQKLPVSRPVRRAAALLWTFGICGAAHELAIVVHEPKNDGRTLFAFLFAGLVASVWPHAAPAATDKSPSARRETAFRSLGKRALLWQLICLFAWIILPRGG
jgi:hypothetical protein